VQDYIPWHNGARFLRIPALEVLALQRSRPERRFALPAQGEQPFRWSPTRLADILFAGKRLTAEGRIA
jgi:hypothetical protein